MLPTRSLVAYFLAKLMEMELVAKMTNSKVSGLPKCRLNILALTKSFSLEPKVLY